MRGSKGGPMGKLYVVCVMWLVMRVPERDEEHAGDDGGGGRVSAAEVAPTEHPTPRGKLLAGTEDLPDGDTLRGMEGPRRASVAGAERVKVVVRATAPSQHFPSKGTSTFLLVLADAWCPQCAAGAVQGLSSMLDIEGVMDDLAALARGDDLRLALEAADVLKKAPSGGMQIEALSADPAVRDEVKALLQK